MLIATGLLVLQADKIRIQIFLYNKICTLKKVAVKRNPAINERKYTKSTT